MFDILYMPPTGNGSVTYTKLSEGSHNFYIKCCWKDRPDVCTDAIKRPFIVNLTDPGGL